jgi:hypothetical protein
MLGLLVELGKSGSEIRERLVQIHGDNAMKKTAGYKWVTLFMREENVPLTSSNEENIPKV